MTARNALVLVNGVIREMPAGDTLNGATGGTGGVAGEAFTASATAPTSPVVGDEWLDLTSGILYSYVNDGDSTQWVELGGTGGAIGASPVFAIGTTTTGAAGSAAAATLSGTALAPLLNLTLPTGAAGPAGSFASYTASLAADQAMAGANSQYTVAQLSNLPAGTYIVFASASIKSPANTAIRGSMLVRESGTIGDYILGASQNVPAGGTSTASWAFLTGHAVITSSGVFSLALDTLSNVASSVTTVTGAQGLALTPGLTTLTAIKLA